MYFPNAVFLAWGSGGEGKGDTPYISMLLVMKLYNWQPI